MLKKLKIMLFSFSSMIMLALPIAIAAPAYAQTTPDVSGSLCAGSNGGFASTDKSCSDTTATTAANKLVTQVIDVISLIVGTVAVIMVIFGGFRYVTSAGNPEGAKTARSTIIYAIIGLVIVALAQIIVHFVLNKTTQATS